MIQINLDNIKDYLASSNLVEKMENVSVEPLGGWWGAMGVSSTLIKVTTSKGCFVLKQPLPKLAVKDYWPCDVDRIFKEKDCMETLAGIIGEKLVPKIVFLDKENYTLIMTCIPEDWVLWKRQLLDGKVDQRIPVKAAEVLAQIHNKTFEDENIQNKFESRKILWQLRIDPYYKTIEKRHPDIEFVVEAEVQRMLKTRVCLVHGDYSPKNIFAKEGEIMLLDHEIAHYGDPSLDFAFCLNHLLLKFIYKSIKNRHIGYEYLKTAENYCNAYLDSVRFWDEQQLNANAVKELGCLMLARIDGKSPVEYITDELTKNVARRISKSILLGSYGRLDQAFRLIDQQLQSLKIFK